MNRPLTRLLLRGAMAACVFMATAQMVKAEENPPGVQPSGRNVGDFLTPEGRFDLEAARRSGYQGPLDMDGFEAVRDPVTGQPLFQRSATDETAANPDDIYWDNRISSSPLAGVNGPVYALMVYDGKLIAGGYFMTTGGVAASQIAAWDGSS